METVSELLELQAGVISRRQATARGLVPHELARLKRRRELVQVHPGVFVNDTHELTWLQRAWAGVLACWPAALTHQSALRSCEGPGRRIALLQRARGWSGRPVPCGPGCDVARLALCG